VTNVNFSVKVLDSTDQCRKPCCWQSIAPAWPVPRLLGCGSHLPTIDDKVVLTPVLRSGVAGLLIQRDRQGRAFSLEFKMRGVRRLERV
jgi:hypothetical protein